MSEQVKISPAVGTWVVRAGGAVLGESDRALEVIDGTSDPVIFFPRDDVAVEFLDDSDTRTNSDALGEAVYFSIVTKSTTLADAVMSYEAPSDAGSDIAGYLGFLAGDLVAVEKL